MKASTAAKFLKAREHRELVAADKTKLEVPAYCVPLSPISTISVSGTPTGKNDRRIYPEEGGKPLQIMKEEHNTRYQHLHLHPSELNEKLSIAATSIHEAHSDFEDISVSVSRVNEADLWCGNSTEDCVNTCAAMDFFLASMKTAWIVIVVLLIVKTPVMSPTSHSLLDYIMTHERLGRNDSTFVLCELTQQLPQQQRKPILIGILLLGFPILPLEMFLTKLIFIAVEMRCLKNCTIWLLLRLLLLIVMTIQALYKQTCFAFESFDVATVPEIVYRIFEIHLGRQWIAELQTERTYAVRRKSIAMSHISVPSDNELGLY